MSDPTLPAPRCVMCRYELTGIQTDLCPECGWHVDASLVRLTDAQAAARRIELIVERVAVPLQRPAEPSFGRRLLAVYATCMTLFVLGVLLFLAYAAIRSVRSGGGPGHP